MDQTLTVGPLSLGGFSPAAAALGTEGASPSGDAGPPLHLSLPHDSFARLGSSSAADCRSRCEQVARAVLPGGAPGTDDLRRVADHLELWERLANAAQSLTAGTGSTGVLAQALADLLAADPDAARDVVSRLASASADGVGRHKTEVLTGLAVRCTPAELAELGGSTLRCLDRVLAATVPAPEVPPRLAPLAAALEGLAAAAEDGGLEVEPDPAGALADGDDPTDGNSIRKPALRAVIDAATAAEVTRPGPARELLTAFVARHLTRLTTRARAWAVCELRLPLPGAPDLRFAGEEPIERQRPGDPTVREASGIAFLPGGWCLLVDDDRGLYSRSPTGEVELLCPLEGLESVTTSPDGTWAWVVCEDDRRVYRLPLQRPEGIHGRVAAAEPELLGRLMQLPGKSNDGWEGLRYVPADQGPWPHPVLIATQENDDRLIAVYPADDLDAEPMLLHLPDEALELLHDVSDLALEPHTGTFVLLSDESQRLMGFAIRVEGDRLVLRPTWVQDLQLPKGAKSEGVDFDADGNVWIAVDGYPRLQRYRCDWPQ